MQKAAFRITDDLPNTEVYCTLTTTPTQRTLGGASLTTKSTSSPFVKSSLMRPTTQTHTFYPEGARPESSGKVQELGRRTGWGLRSFERNVQGRSTSLSRGGPSSPPRSPHFTYSYSYLSSPLLSSHKTWTTHHTPVEVVGAVTIRLYNSPMGT